ncbi:MAG TPA: class I adenylate-forming enzyme family protein [Bacteroidales bacterium]|nr:class I adenylate-forming enzyme family protein [Bacteroidales bacterium]
MNAVDYFFETSSVLEKEFVIGSKEKVTFKNLYSQSNNLAIYLQKTIGENQNILLIAPNSVFFIIAYLGIMKSGNTVVPLNPEVEQANLDYIQNKCQSPLVLTTSRIKARFELRNIGIIDEVMLNEITEVNESFQPLKSDTNSNQLAEIIFTSGSTGEPKGVMISHKNLIANTASIIQYLVLGSSDTMLVVLPFYYCYGLSLLHTHLRVGGSIVLNNMFIMLGGIINDLKKYKCTGFAGVPSHFQILLRKSNSFKNSTFPDLKYVTQAGGKLHNAFISEFIESFPSIKFNVMYGQTEATARLAWLPPEMLPGKIGSCGKAIPGVTLRVSDDKGKDIKPGETGEILAYGDNIMQGYYRDPESTAQAIINGWLRTGDLATVDNEGFIYLTARKKEIIKVGGRRISPKEIEEVIVSMPEVIDCNIEGVYDDLLGEAIKATVVLKENLESPIGIEQLKAWCYERLATYKVPQIIQISDNITITATGKKLKKQS